MLSCALLAGGQISLRSMSRPPSTLTTPPELRNTASKRGRRQLFLPTSLHDLRVIMCASVEVAIIGAGPYGLSIAAHLQARGIEFRIFGSPMHSWRTQMPAGMFLKSEGFASSLYDPGGRFTLKRFCAEGGLPYAD